ncbi:sensor histidine kinase [Halodesulfurarchaeum sp.]|uniref:sensor histidine kinase n=1 Tax=Halodesulfurarchaeum sp. TaxID=1980530 RepID=UPI002FC313BA
MLPLLISLLLISGVYLIVSVIFILIKDNKVWTKFGGPIALIGLTTTIIGLFGFLSEGFLAGTSYYSNIVSFAAYLIPLFVAMYAVIWFIFINQYIGILSTGHEAILALIAGPMLLAMPLGTTWTYMDGGFVEPIAIFALFPEIVLKLSAFFVAPFHFAFTLAGLFVLIWGVYQYTLPTVSFAVALFASGPIWYFTIYIAAPVFGLQSWLFQFATAVTGLIGLVGVWFVISEGSLTDQRPITSNIGRNAVIEEMDQPVLVLNRDWNVADVNPAASQIFSFTKTELLGKHISELLPGRVTAELSDSTNTLRVTLGKSRNYDIRVSTVTSGRGTDVGKTLIFTDVTEQERRKQQVQVLNRVLRHNLRNKGTTALGYVDLIQKSESYNPDHMDKLSAAITELAQTGHRAQEVQRMMSADRLQNFPTKLTEIINQSIRSLHDELAIDVTIDVPEHIQVVANEQILVPMITEALRNAVTHTDDTSPRISVSENAVDEHGELVVLIEDDGPGIPPEEIKVIRKGEEDPLKHGSGFGLWLLHWGAIKLGGSVSFRQEGVNETGVRFHLPADIVRISGNTVSEEAI